MRDTPEMIETDYLIVGAGLSGMSFADSLICESDAELVLVDRRHLPGGHWNGADPFVRLDMPSATYGVDSRELGSLSIDRSGHNSGLYERATGHEERAYFHRVLEDDLLPTGRVRFLGACDYPDHTGGEHRARSRLTGKTGMGTCQWLLDNGVDPDAIRWIRPRDPWALDRAYYRPLDRVDTFVEGHSLQLEAAAEAYPDDDVDRNRLCPPDPYPDAPGDWIPWTLRGLHTDAIWSDEPDLQSWLRASRLNLARGLHDHLSEPRIRSAFERLANYHGAAIVNLGQRLEQRPAPGPAWAA